MDKIEHTKGNQKEGSQLRIQKCLFIGKSAQVLARQVQLISNSVKKSSSSGISDQDIASSNLDNIILRSMEMWIEDVSKSASFILQNGLSTTDWASEKYFQHDESIKSEDGLLAHPLFPSMFISKFLHYNCEAINRIEAFSIKKVFSAI